MHGLLQFEWLRKNQRILLWYLDSGEGKEDVVVFCLEVRAPPPSKATSGAAAEVLSGGGSSTDLNFKTWMWKNVQRDLILLVMFLLALIHLHCLSIGLHALLAQVPTFYTSSCIHTLVLHLLNYFGPRLGLRPFLLHATLFLWFTPPPIVAYYAFTLLFLFSIFCSFLLW